MRRYFFALFAKESLLKPQHSLMPPTFPDFLPAVSCADVRAKVAEHGKAYSYAWARLNGYTAAQINEAKKCIR